MDTQIREILSKYSSSFSEKDYSNENNDTDILMDLFSITPDLKRENRQYWGRELGMAWELITKEIFKHNNTNFKEAESFGADKPIDFIVGSDAIDTKYRIGSGDSGTLKKFKQYGKLLSNNGYKPIFLILRNDNLPAAITAAIKGGWDIKIGNEAIKYIYDNTNINIIEYLSSFGNEFKINR